VQQKIVAHLFYFNKNNTKTLLIRKNIAYKINNKYICNEVEVYYF